MSSGAMGMGEACAVLRGLERHGLRWRVVAGGGGVAIERQGLFATLLRYVGEERREWLDERFYWGVRADSNEKETVLSASLDLPLVASPATMAHWIAVGDSLDGMFPDSWDADPAAWIEERRLFDV